MTNEYTPTTDEVRTGFTAPLYKVLPQQPDEDFAAYLSRMSIETMHAQNASGPAFDRWIAAHDAEVRATALEEAARSVERFFPDPCAPDAEECSDCILVREIAAAIRAVQENPGKDN